MRPHTIHVAEGFWNVRGSFKIGGVLDVGTQASLVRRKNGKFIFLDAYTVTAGVKKEIGELTRDGAEVEVILNVHPFHTVHVKKAHRQYPGAKLYGTARHRSHFPELPWESFRTEDPALHELYAEDLEFSVPRGVDFISKNENVHFSSVLVLHRSSKTIHVDDTLMYFRLPRLLRVLGQTDTMSFHPTLAKALERRKGAARGFREWAETLLERWSDAENLCAAHNGALIAKRNQGASVAVRMRSALDRADRTLAAHERKYG